MEALTNVVILLLCSLTIAIIAVFILFPRPTKDEQEHDDKKQIDYLRGYAKQQQLIREAKKKLHDAGL